MKIEEIPPDLDFQEREGALARHGLYRVGLTYGRFLYRFRWLVIALWVLVLVASVPIALQTTKLLSGGGYSFGGSESVHVSTLFVDKLHYPNSQTTVVFQSEQSSVSDPAYQQEINALSDKFHAYQYTKSVTSGGVGKDGRTTFLAIGFSKDADFMQQHISDLRAMLPSGSAMSPAKVYLTDQIAIADELTQTSQQDTERADGAVLPIALLVLLIVFGTLTAAIMPLLLALIAIPVSLALIYPIALNTSISTFILSVVSIIGLGISIDYSLFITRRFREELALGHTVRDAIAWSVATAGEAILFSGLTVMLGFCGLLLIGIGMTTSQGIGGAAVVATAVIAALSLLPALLCVLGERINRLRVPYFWRLTMPAAQDPSGANSGQASFWHRLALWVMRRPIMIILVVCVILVGLGWPLFSLNIGTSNVSILPSSSEARQGYDILTAQYPALNQSPVDIMAQTPDSSSILSADNLNRVAQLTQWVSEQKHVTGIVSLLNPPMVPGTKPLSQQQLILLYSSGQYRQIPALAQFVAATTANDLTLITVRSDTRLDSNEGKALIDNFRNNGKQHSQNLALYVGGLQATYQDFDRYLYSNFPKSIFFIIGTTFLLLLLMFRSILLPLKAVLMNMLSVGVTYGALIFVFQWGNFSNLLGFTSEGFVDSLVPILLFCILFGLSMDYEVFLLSRIREEWLRTSDNRLAVAIGLEKTGSVITNAALLFVIVTVAFTFTSLIITKEIGLGMTVAILVDATIIRTLLVPATMRLLGRWNWWFPGRPLPPEQHRVEVGKVN